MKNFTICISVILLLFSQNDTVAQVSWELAPEQNLWNESMQIAVAGDIGYVISTSGFKSKNFVTGAITTLASPPFNTSAALVSKAYIFHRQDFIYCGVKGSNTSQFAKYNIATNTWSSLVAPTSSSEVSVNNFFVTEENLYLSAINNTSSFFKFNFSSQSWSTMSGIASNSVKLVYTHNGKGRCVVTSGDYYEYNETTSSWTHFDLGGSANILANSIHKSDSIFSWSAYPNTTSVFSINSTFTYNSPASEQFYIPSGTYNDHWVWNNTVFVSAGGITKRLRNLCMVEANLNTSVASNLPILPGVGLSATTTLSAGETYNTYFSYSWGPENLAYGNSSSTINLQNSATAGNQDIILTATNGFCIITDTVQIPILESKIRPMTHLPYGTPGRMKAIGFGFEEFALLGLGSSTNNNGTFYLDDLWLLNYNTSELTATTPFPAGARAITAYLTFDNKGYMLGGNNSTQTFNDFWCFDPEANIWTELAPFPESMFADGFCYVINNEIYAGKGSDVSNTIYKYSIPNNVWTLVTSIPGMGNFSPNTFLSFVFNNELYLSQGSISKKYNSLTNVWTTITIPYLSAGSNRWAHVHNDFVLIYFGTTSITFYPTLNSSLPSSPLSRYGLLTAGATHFDNGLSSYLAFGKHYNSTSYENGGVNSQVDGFSEVIFELDENNCGISSAISTYSNEIRINRSCEFLVHPYNTQVEYQVQLNNQVDPVEITNESSTYFLPQADSVGMIDLNLICSSNGCQETYRNKINVLCDVPISSAGSFTTQPKQRPGYWVVDGIQYITLGYINGGVTTPLWSYNLSTNVWSQLASFPGTSRHDGTCFALDNKLYYVGGKNNNYPPDEYFTALNCFADVYVYDIANNTWSNISSHPEGPICCLSSWTYNGKAYIFGGITSPANNGKKTYEFDPQSNTWTLLTTFPEAYVPIKGAIVIDNNFAYLSAGFQASNATEYKQFLTKVHRFNHDSNTWEYYCNGLGSYTNIASGLELAEPTTSMIKDERIFVGQYSNFFTLDMTKKIWSYYKSAVLVGCSDSFFEGCELIQNGVQQGDKLYYITNPSPSSTSASPVPINYMRIFDPSNLQCEPTVSPYSEISSNSNTICLPQPLELTSLSQSSLFTYQWKLDNVNIPNANTYNFFATTGGSYTLVVSAGSTSVESDPFVLTSEDLPFISSTEIITSNICDLNETNLVISNNTTSSIQWLMNNSPIALANNDTLLVTENAQYQALITSQIGNCTALSPIWNVSFVNCNCDGDFNLDGMVDIIDFTALISQYGCLNDCDYDLNADGFITVADLMVFLSLSMGECTQ